MITIQDIHIAYDSILIENGTLKIEEGKLTAIQGKSGSGKTSLLSIVGLLSNGKCSHYYFNKHLIHFSDEEIALFRKKHIGYVFQDNSLLDHLSIYENLKFYCRMINREIDENQAKAILGLVHLDKNIHQETTTLSGGERQRLAIACAISKQPELLILDEPTSALDDINRQNIMDLLKELAKKGMMVFIASHDKKVIEQCDVVYEIKNKQLICHHIVNQNNEQTLSKDQVHLNFKFYLSYYFKYFKANIWNYSLLFFMCGLAIAILVSFYSISNGYENKQLENMDILGNREIFITSKKDSQGKAKYRHTLPVLDEDIIKKIAAQEDCSNYYPYYEADVNHLIYQNNEYALKCIVQPYAKEKHLGDFVEIGHAMENGIYISASLAKQLSLETINQDTFSFTMHLPDQTTVDISDLKIDGILESSVPNPYSNASNIIYMPIDNMPQQSQTRALIVYASHYHTTQALADHIETINGQLGIFHPFNRIGQIDAILENMRAFAPFIIAILFLICSMMTFLIYSRYISQRQKEMLLLKVNGLSKKEVTYLILVELFVQAIVIALVSMIFISALYIYVSYIKKIALEINYLRDSTIVLVFAFLWMMIPSAISLWIFQRDDIAQALRND